MAEVITFRHPVSSENPGCHRCTTILLEAAAVLRSGIFTKPYACNRQEGASPAGSLRWLPR
jgi:hypothetical protein